MPKHITVGGIRYTVEDSFEPTEEDMADLATLSEYLTERVAQGGILTTEMEERQEQTRARIRERNARLTE